MGIRPERLQLEWISAAEGQRFGRMMREIEELRKKVAEGEVNQTIEILMKEEKRERAKKLKRETALQPAEAV